MSKGAGWYAQRRLWLLQVANTVAVNALGAYLDYVVRLRCT